MHFCSNVQELHDTSPNFIIVYDLQSGTLFKKWKPESSSCSIAISSQGGCVVNGLENTWVLVWDLSTGARRLVFSYACKFSNTAYYLLSGISKSMIFF